MNAGLGSEDVLMALLPLVALIGALGLTAHWMSVRRGIRELEIKERIALIEKGLAPPPELTPTGSLEGTTLPPARADRYRTAGILFVGLGFALMLLLWAAAKLPEIGLGVGGAIVILGGALIANSVFGGGGRRPN